MTMADRKSSATKPQPSLNQFKMKSMEQYFTREALRGSSACYPSARPRRARRRVRARRARRHVAAGRGPRAGVGRGAGSAGSPARAPSCRREPGALEQEAALHLASSSAPGPRRALRPRLGLEDALEDGEELLGRRGAADGVLALARAPAERAPGRRRAVEDEEGDAVDAVLADRLRVAPPDVVPMFVAVEERRGGAAWAGQERFNVDST